jgi:SAM-dependent methyltransferase
MPLSALAKRDATRERSRAVVASDRGRVRRLDRERSHSRMRRLDFRDEALRRGWMEASRDASRRYARSVARREPVTVSSRTLAHYEAHAVDFWEGTKDHDVSQNYDALLGAIEGTPPFCLLDFGCGPGRDLKHFRSLGHEAVGLEGCHAFCEMARAYSGCEVLEQDFLALSLPPGRFDGVFANAALFHVPSRELPRVLGELRAALKPRGVLFSSNPRGHGEEGWQGERYCCYWDLDGWRRVVTAAGFQELAHYYRPPGKPRAEQPWLATVWRRVDP